MQLQPFKTPLKIVLEYEKLFKKIIYNIHYEDAIHSVASIQHAQGRGEGEEEAINALFVCSAMTECCQG